MDNNMQIVAAASACKNVVEAQYVEMIVPLYSYGCEKKVKKTLSHLKGIYSVNVDYHRQKVTVWGICNKYDVLETVRTKRKEARFWNPDDNQSVSDLPPSPLCLKQSSAASNKPPLAIIKVRSFSLKALKKLVFTRSYSF